jgi:hypothetical protein
MHIAFLMKQKISVPFVGVSTCFLDGVSHKCADAEGLEAIHFFLTFFPMLYVLTVFGGFLILHCFSV